MYVKGDVPDMLHVIQLSHVVAISYCCRVVCICLSVCLLVRTLGCAEVAEPMEMWTCGAGGTMY